jgi:hypothetical protein
MPVLIYQNVVSGPWSWRGLRDDRIAKRTKTSGYRQPSAPPPGPTRIRAAVPALTGDERAHTRSSCAGRSVRKPDNKIIERAATHLARVSPAEQRAAVPRSSLYRGIDDIRCTR